MLDNIGAVFTETSGFPVKGALGHPASSGGFQTGNMAIEPEGAIFRKIVRQGFDFAPKAHAALSGRGNAFGLSGTDAFPLILGNERKHLQDKVGNECSEQVFVPPGVEQGHVQNENVHALFLGQHAPLFQNFLIIAAEAVNAGDAKLTTQSKSTGLSF